MKINRLLSILVLLLNREKVSASELSKRFEVAERTIYRDMDALAEAGIPIAALPGKNGGYSLLPDYRIDRQLLQPESAVSVLSALKGVQKTLQDNDLDQAIERMKSIFPRHQMLEMERKSNRIVFDTLPFGMSGDDAPHFRLLYEAVCGSRLIEAVYLGSNAPETQRTLEPLTLIYKGFSWYLFAYCRLRQAFRYFKLSRFQSVRLLTSSFPARDIPPDQLKDWNEAPPPMVKLSLELSPEGFLHGREHFKNCTVLPSDKPGWKRIETEMPEGDWLVSFVLSFGRDAELIGPEKLRTRIAEEIGGMKAYYHSRSI